LYFDNFTKFMRKSRINGFVRQALYSWENDKPLNIKQANSVSSLLIIR